MSEKPNPFVPGQTALAPPVEPGIHPGICVGLYDIGTHVDQVFNKKKRKYVIEFELPAADPKTLEDGTVVPRTLSTTVTASMHPKGMLRPLLEGWRGKTFTEEEANSYDISKILGKPAQLNVVHDSKNSKTYANIRTILPAPKGSNLIPKITPATWSVTSLDEPSELEQVDIPEWVKKRVAESEEYKNLRARTNQSQQDAGGDVSPEDF